VSRLLPLAGLLTGLVAAGVGAAIPLSGALVPEAARMAAGIAAFVLGLTMAGRVGPLRWPSHAAAAVLLLLVWAVAVVVLFKLVGIVPVVACTAAAALMAPDPLHLAGASVGDPPVGGEPPGHAPPGTGALAAAAGGADLLVLPLLFLPIGLMDGRTTALLGEVLVVDLGVAALVGAAAGTLAGRMPGRAGSAGSAPLTLTAGVAVGVLLLLRGLGCDGYLGALVAGAALGRAAPLRSRPPLTRMHLDAITAVVLLLFGLAAPLGIWVGWGWSGLAAGLTILLVRGAAGLALGGADRVRAALIAAPAGAAALLYGAIAAVALADAAPLALVGQVVALSTLLYALVPWRTAG